MDQFRPTPPALPKYNVPGQLAEEGRFAPDAGRLLEMLCEKLTALRIPIARATTHVRTLQLPFHKRAEYARTHVRSCFPLA